MSHWNILGIDPTVDIKLIKKAYARNLKLQHPEDNPEFFQTLREAYENALKEAKYITEVKSSNVIFNKEASSIDDTPIPTADTFPSHNDFKENNTSTNSEKLVENFMNKVNEIYCDFFTRIEVTNWKLLLEDKDFWYFGIQQKLSYSTLNFLMNNYNLPHKVWVLLNNYFSWTDKVDELYDEFNNNFIDYILGEITSPWELRYDFFKKDCNCNYDEFIALRSNAYFALIDNKLNDAKVFLTKAMDIFKDDADLVRMLGLYYLRVNDYENACSAFSHLIEIAPKEIDGYLNRGPLLITFGKINEAYYDFEEALNLDSNNLSALKGLAQCYYHFNKFIEAKLLYEQICEECPYDIDAKTRIIEVNTKLIEQYKLELANNSNNINTIYKLANVYFELNCFEECFNTIKTISKTSLNSDMYLLLARALSGMNNNNEAIKYFDKALKINYKNKENGYEALFYRGVTNYELSNYDAAIKDLEQVLKINPYNTDALDDIADCYRLKDECDKALQYSNKAIDIDSSKWIYYSTRALIYYNLRKYKESLDDHKAVVFYMHTFSGAWYRKGYCHLQLAQYDEAIASFKEAIEWFDTRYKDINLRIALSYFQLKNFKEALKYIKIHCEKNPNDVFGLILTGDVYRSLMNGAKADEAYYSALKLKPNSLKLLRILAFNALAYKNYQKAFDYFNQLLSSVKIAKEATNLGLELEDLYSYLSMISYKQNDMKTSTYYNELAIKTNLPKAGYKNYLEYLFRYKLRKLFGQKSTSKENWSFENLPKYNPLFDLNISIGGHYETDL